jgi:hypothetical protein
LRERHTLPQAEARETSLKTGGTLDAALPGIMSMIFPIRGRLAPALVFCVVACGGSTQSASDAGHVEAGQDASKAHDSGKAPDGAACVADPVVGAACATGAEACSPGNACCGGLWRCDPSTHEWDLDRAHCACILDAGGMDGSSHVDAGHDAGFNLDAGVSVGSCSACSKDEVCAATTTSGGACQMANDAGMCPNGGTAPPGGCCFNSTTVYKCWQVPSGCATGLTCGCAAELCMFCGCQGVTEAGALQCQCDAP